MADGVLYRLQIGDSKNHTDEGVTPSAQGIQNIMYIAYSTDGREICEHSTC